MSYNFTGTTTTLQYCAGVVKAQPLFPKSPAQHAADFDMLQGEEELKNVFLQPNGDRKPILCVRVDGASDEGPSHEEIQFFWTRDHILKVASLSKIIEKIIFEFFCFSSSKIP